MKKDITNNISIHEIAIHSILGKYFINLCYGWDSENDNRRICDLYPDVWPIDDMVKSLNYIIDLDLNKKIELLFPFKNSDVNILLIKNKPNSKVAFIFSGGGYCSVCNMVEGLPVAMELYRKGYSIVLGTYSITSQNNSCLFDKPFLDVINFIKYFDENKDKYQIDMDDYIIGGFSAGGHVVGELLTDNIGLVAHNMKLPKLLFLGYPVITMSLKAYSLSREMLIGKNPSNEDIGKYSIEKHLSNKKCKVYVWQCKRDKQVPVENTSLLCDALKEKKYPFIYRTYNSDAHGWGIGTGKECEGWVDEMLDFADNK